MCVHGAGAKEGFKSAIGREGNHPVEPPPPVPHARHRGCASCLLHREAMGTMYRDRWSLWGCSPHYTRYTVGVHSSLSWVLTTFIPTCSFFLGDYVFLYSSHFFSFLSFFF